MVLDVSLVALHSWGRAGEFPGARALSLHSLHIYDGGISMSPLRRGVRVSCEETFHHLHTCAFARVNSSENWRAGALSVKML